MKKESAEIMDEKTNEINVLIDQDPDYREIINWQPLYDLYTIDNEVIISIDLAGVLENEIYIYLNKYHVQLIGTRRPLPPLKRDCCTFHTVEIPYGRFYQKIDFPVPVQTRGYTLNYSTGMLVMRIPVIKETIIKIED